MTSLRGRDLLLATGNAGKIAEFSALLLPFDVRLLGLKDLGLGEPEEDQASFVGNALVKARAGARASGLVTLADDSGLEVEGLGGGPGIHTADWAEAGEGRDFSLAMRKVQDLLEATRTPAPRRAWFCCVLALVWPEGREELFTGRLEGEIVWPPRGAKGHGYDPVFRPIGYDVTMGEMDAAAKNAISHRAKAVEAFVSACFT